MFTGTSEIYGAVDVPFREDATVEPGSPYAVSKYAAERFCRMLHRGRGWPIVPTTSEIGPCQPGGTLGRARSAAVASARSAPMR